MKIALLAFASLSVTFAVAQAPARRTPVHRPIRTAACPAVPAAPTLPPGIPAAQGKLDTAFALRFVDVKTGEGAAAEPGQVYTVHYTGWLAADGTKFDSSLDRAEPITFQQGAHRVIPGWDNGFAGMHIGGKRRLFIPYQLAYGEQGRPPVIPPKSDLIFDIELLSQAPVPGSMPEPMPTPPPQSAQPQSGSDPQSATPNPGSPNGTNPNATNPNASNPNATSPNAAGEAKPQPRP